MTNFDGKEMQEEFNRAFGNLQYIPTMDRSDRRFSITNLTPQQLWFLVKFAKHVRGRCRSTAAFNNYMNRNFNAQFKEIPKEYDGRKYNGLQIIVDGEVSEQES